MKKLILLFVLLPALCYGVPVIDAPVIGSIVDGESITITGSGFGIKNPVAPKRWADFNGGTVGELLDEDGWYITYSANTYCWPEYSVNETRDGTPVGQFCGERSLDGYDFQTMRTDGAIITDQKCFVKGKIWFDWGTNYPPPPGEISKVKLMYWYPSTGNYSDDPEVQLVAEFDGNTGSGNNRWARYEVLDCGFSGERTQYTATFNNHQWNDFQFVFDKGSLDTPDAYLLTTINYNDFFQSGDTYPINGSHMECSGGLTLNRFMIGAYLSNVPAGHTVKLYYDDVYVDDTWARVEMGDNISYTSCNNREIQIPRDTWTDGQLTFTVNVGTFTPGQHAYIFVIDADNNPPDEGVRVTVGSGQEPTMSYPENLQVNVE